MWYLIPDYYSEMNRVDVTKMPPVLPRGIGTRLWPRYSGYQPEDKTGIPIPDQMTRLSMMRRWGEKAMSRRGQDHEMVKDRRMWESYAMKKPYCYKCSETKTDVNRQVIPTYHRHRSSMKVRLAVTLNEQGMYDCNTCEQTPHHYKQGDRIPVLVTASTLANWQGGYRENGRYAGNPFHLDSVEVPGATIRELLHAFLAEYQFHWCPLDVILCGGLNNLLQGHSNGAIIEELAEFKEMVLGQREGNTCAILTIIYPPKLCRLPLDPRPPSDQFRDRTQDIRALNGYIKGMNSNDQEERIIRLTPQPHTFGLKINPNGRFDGPLGRVNSHNVKAWREMAFEDKLHLSDLQRLKVGKTIVKYYEHLYGMRETSFFTREEERAALEEEMRECERKNAEIKETSKDARRAIMLATERRLTEDVTHTRWIRTEEEVWRRYDILEDEFLVEEYGVDEGEDVAESRPVTYTGGGWPTCYEDNEEGCLGCCACDRLK